MYHVRSPILVDMVAVVLQITKGMQQAALLLSINRWKIVILNITITHEVEPK